MTTDRKSSQGLLSLWEKMVRHIRCGNLRKQILDLLLLIGAEHIFDFRNDQSVSKPLKEATR
jgi:hypothetical protein